MSRDRPRFRRDLLAVPLEADGQRYVEVRDPSTGGSFRLYDIEYRVALAFDGLAFAQIIPWLRLATGLELPESELREFATRLGELGLLEPDAEDLSAARIPAASEQPTASAAPTLAREPVGAVPPVSEEPSPAAPSVLDEAVTPALEMSETRVPPAVAEEEAVEPPTPVGEEVAATPAVVVEEAVAEGVAASAPVVEAEALAPAVVAEAPHLMSVESIEAIPAVLAMMPTAAATVEEAEAAAAEDAPVAAEEAAPAADAEAPHLMSAESIEAMPAVKAPTSEAGVAAGTLEEGELVSEGTADAVSTQASPAESPPAEPWAASAQAMPEALAPAEEPLPEAAVVREEAAPVEEMPEPVVAPDGAAPEPFATSEAAAPWPAEPPAEASPPPEEAPADSGIGPEAEPAAEAPLPSETIAEASAFAPESPEETEPAAARPVDSTAFPVLPTPPPRATTPPPRSTTPRVVTPPPRSTTPRVVTPPVRTTPPPYVTPRPATLGPLLVAHQAALRRRQRRSLLVFGSLGVLAAAAVLAIMLPFFFPPHGPPRVDVRTLAATPGTVYRYFASTGAVTPLPGPVMKFPAAGRVTRIAAPGTVVAVGDVVAAVEGAKSLQSQLAHQRERLAFYQQIADAMRQVGNTAEEERQAAKVEERKAKVEKTLRALAQVAVVAGVAGEVEEVFTREGETVEAGSLALRLRSAGQRATFELPAAQAAEARRLAFCQVGVDGYVMDCTPANDRPDDARITVEIAKLPAALLGRPARLVRAHFDGAVALPASAIQSAGRHRQVFVVSPDGRVEVRPVTVAELNPTEAIVVQGLDAGEHVILEPAPSLRPGARVSVTQ